MAEIGPKIPRWLDQIQFIKYYLSNPCDVPYMAYIETALPIAGDIAITLLDIDIQTFLQRTFRPKWVRGWRHTRRGPRGRKRAGGIPDPAEMIADALDPDGDLRPNKWPFGTWIVVQSFELIDRVFWTIFVIEMSETLLMNSIIGVIEENTENCPNITRFLRTDQSTGGGGAEPTDNPVNIDTLRYSVGITAQTGFYASLPEGDFVVVFSGNIGAVNGPTTARPDIIRSVFGTETREEGPEFTLEEGQYEPFVVSMRQKGPCTAMWRVWRGPGFYNIQGASLFIIQVGD